MPTLTTTASRSAVAVAETDAGPALVGPNGMTLYIFTQDTERHEHLQR